MYQLIVKIGATIQVASIAGAVAGFCMWIGYTLQHIANSI